MRRITLCLFLLLLFSFIFTKSSIINASSSQAYQDYLYQFDLYRQSYSDFTVAKNEYLKFKTLTSETTALEKTKSMLSQRDLLLRAYLLLLNEKLNEDRGLRIAERQTYQAQIRNEIIFLENQSQLVPSIGSLSDAQTVSKQLESHYLLLQTSIRQTIIAITLGTLANLAKQYDSTMTQVQSLLSPNRTIFTPEKQATIDRWMLQITNKRSLYQQKIDAIASLNAQLTGNDINDVDRKFADAQRQLTEARQYLVEGAAFLQELMNVLRFQD